MSALKLSDFELFPGVIIEDKDPENRGRVKVCCPGIFDPDTMDADSIMWVHPVMSGGRQTFHQMLKGDKVWVLHNQKNYFSYHYIPYFELNDNTAALIDGTETDILISRTAAEGDTQIYWKKEEGITAKVGEGSVNINKSGDIKVEAPSSVDIASEKVNVGLKEGSYENAVMGISLQAAFEALTGALLKFAAGLGSDPWAAPAAADLIAQLNIVKTKISREALLSDTVSISK